jgi:hypothetical protein
MEFLGYSRSDELRVRQNRTLRAVSPPRAPNLEPRQESPTINRSANGYKLVHRPSRSDANWRSPTRIFTFSWRWANVDTAIGHFYVFDPFLSHTIDESPCALDEDGSRALWFVRELGQIVAASFFRRSRLWGQFIARPTRN